MAWGSNCYFICSFMKNVFHYFYKSYLHLLLDLYHVNVVRVVLYHLWMVKELILKIYDNVLMLLACLVVQEPLLLVTCHHHLFLNILKLFILWVAISFTRGACKYGKLNKNLVLSYLAFSTVLSCGSSSLCNPIGSPTNLFLKIY